MWTAIEALSIAIVLMGSVMVKGEPVFSLVAPLPPPPSPSKAIRDFLEATRFIVVGASARRQKWGNKVIRCYQQHGKEVVGVHPLLKMVEGVASYPSLSCVPNARDAGVSVITTPVVTLRVIEEAAALGLSKHIWLQPGAHNQEVLDRARELGVEVIYGGPCVLVEMDFNDNWTIDDNYMNSNL